MAGFLSAAMAAVGSSSIGNAVVRILIAYGISRLINRTQPDPSASAPIDAGVRLQLSPDTTNPIPLLFGSAYFGGRVTDAQLVDQNKTMWFCLTLCEVPNITTRLSDSATIKTNIDSVYLDNQLVTFKSDGITVDYVTNQDEGTVNTSPRDLIQIYLYEKGSFAPTLPSNFLSGGSPISPAVLPADARILFPDWTNDHRMVNVTFALVKIIYNRDKGITALPNLQFQVSNNLFKPGDALYSYMTNTISGAGISSSNIDTATLVALNSYSTATVNYFDESDSTVKTLANRYQINGLVNTKDNVLSNLQRLADNSGAFLNYDITTGTWGVVINRDSASVLSFNDSNIISGIDLTGTTLDSLYNSVRVEFPHRQVRDQRDVITLDLPTDYRNANEPDNELQITLDLINEPLQARELGYLALYQNRMDQVVTFATDYSKINTEAGDVISITSSVYGWTDKPYRVIRVKEIEGEDGGIAVEITAQEYDETMYTAGGQLRRPRVPTKPIAIPDITIIGTPAAPTVTQFNSIAVPYFRLTGVVPSGIVDRFEFWYSSTAGYADSTFVLLGTVSNSNGSPYVQGVSVIFTAEALPAGTYKFKVRAGNESAFGSYSALSAENVWLPVQVTDQVSNTTKISPGTDLASLLPILGAGALAYFAYKALYPQALSALSTTQLGKLLGLPTDQEVIAQKAKLDAQTNPFQEFVVGANNILSTVTPTVTFVGGTGVDISADSISGTITIAANGETTAGVSKIIAGEGIAIAPTTGIGDVTISVSGGGGGTGPVDSGGANSGNSYVLNGSVFPNRYEIDGANPPNDKPAIFTHTNMVISNSAYGTVIKPQNVVLPETILTPVLTVSTTDVVPGEPPAEITYDTDQFTGGPSTASTDTAAEAAARAQAVAKATAKYTNTWTETSFNEVKFTLNDNGTYTATYILRVQYPTESSPSTDTRTDNYRYYSTCTYNSALGLPQQAWSAWKKWKDPVIQTTQILSGSTNPPIPSTTGYIVDGEYTPGGVGLKLPSSVTGGDALYHDYFLPNTPTYTTKTVTIENQTVKCEPGQMVAFGVCNRDLGDTVAFATNTIFGVEASSYVNSPTASISFPGTKAVTNGSRWVSPHPWADDILYWSNDSIVWNKVKDVTFLNSAVTNQDVGIFSLMPYNPVIGKFFAYRYFYYRNPNANSIAYSTDGINWTEDGSALPWGDPRLTEGPLTILSNNTSGHYIGYYQRSFDWIGYFSSNGLTWTALSSAITSLGDYAILKPIPDSSRWLIGSVREQQEQDGIKYFTLPSMATGTYTFASGVHSIETYVDGLLNQIFDGSGRSRANYIGHVVVTPISATSFYVSCIGSALFLYTPPETFNQGTRIPLYSVYGIYTISGNSITASSFSTTPTTVTPQEGLVYTLPSASRTLKLSAPIAYATTYNYPGVAGTPIIYRAGDYGVGAYTNSVSLKTTYST
jgi:hypothetical protein